MKKTFLASLLAILLVINSISFVFASGDVVSVEMDITQSSESYNALDNGENGVIGGSTPRVELKEGDYEVFDITVPQAGDYSLLFYASCVTADTKVKVSYKTDGEYIELAEGNVEKSVNILKNATSSFGAVTLPEGDIKLKFETVSGVCRFNKFSIELSAAFEIVSITANKAETTVEEGVYLPRSTSSIKVNFSGSINQDTVKEDTAVLLKGTQAVETKIIKNASSFEIIPTATLDYSTEYTIYINGVKNSAGNYSIDEYSLNFTTTDKASDTGLAEIKDDELTSAGRNAYISGKLIDENGNGVSGRYINLYYTPLGGEETAEAVVSDVTEKDGVFNVSYAIAKGSQTGDYTFRLEAEYAEDKIYTFSYDAEAALSALTQVINVRDHNATLSSPQNETFIGSGADTFISFNGYPKDAQVFDVNIPEDGHYAITMIAGTGNGAKINIYYSEGTSEDEILINEITTVSTGGLSVFKGQAVGAVELKEGLVRIRFVITHSDIHFRGFEIKYLNPITVSSATANGETLSEGDVVKRGTDSFEIDFSEKIDASLTDAVITVSDDEGKELKTEAAIKDDKLRIYLLESLDYEKDYKITVSGVKDMFGAYTAEDFALGFKSSDKASDSGKAEITEVQGTADYAVLSVSAKMISSEGKAIKGRNYEIYLKDPNGNISEAPIASGKTSDGGLINASITMEDDDLGGIYTFILKGDYAEKEPTVKLIYISKTMEADISQKIKDAQTAEEIKTIFEENEVVLGINIDTDMANVNDKNKVYAHMAGKDAKSLDDIQKLYRESIALETINQAVVPGKVEAVFADEQAMSDLELSKDKFDLLKDENRENFIADVVALERVETKEALSDALDVVFNKHMAIQLEKLPIGLASENVTAEAGTGARVALVLSEEVSDVKMITFKIKADDVLLENASVTAETGEYTAEVKDGVMTVVITPGKNLNKATEFGKVYISTEKTAKTYDVKIFGEILYSVKVATDKGDVLCEVSNVINEKTITVTTTPAGTIETPQRPTSSSSSGSSRPSAVIPDVPPSTEPTDEPIVEKFAFIDLGEASWAKESVELLLSKGIVAESADKKFNPNVNVKREEFIKMVVLACGIYDENAKCDFTDVKEDSWYYGVVASAKNAGIINGRDDGSFGSGDNITRQEMAAIVFRAMKKTETAENPELFADDELIAPYAKDAVYTLKAEGIINGMGDNLFAPNGVVTRAMAAKLAAGLLK